VVRQCGAASGAAMRGEGSRAGACADPSAAERRDTAAALPTPEAPEAAEAEAKAPSQTDAGVPSPASSPKGPASPPLQKTHTSVAK